MRRTKKRKTTYKRSGSFLSRVQRTPRVKRVKAKIRKVKAEAKKLSREYRAAIKKESKRLSK